jgi:hypothetical protein
MNALLMKSGREHEPDNDNTFNLGNLYNSLGIPPEKRLLDRSTVDKYCCVERLNTLYREPDSIFPCKNNTSNVRSAETSAGILPLKKLS